MVVNLHSLPIKAIRGTFGSESSQIATFHIREICGGSEMGVQELILSYIYHANLNHSAWGDSGAWIRELLHFTP